MKSLFVNLSGTVLSKNNWGRKCDNPISACVMQNDNRWLFILLPELFHWTIEDITNEIPSYALAWNPLIATSIQEEEYGDFHSSESGHKNDLL